MSRAWRRTRRTALIGTAAFTAVIGSGAIAAGTASATGITSPAGATPTIKAEAEGHVALDNPIATINCASSVEGKVESHGEGVTAKGNISALSFSSCTNSWHVTVAAAGSLEIHYISGSNGTVTSSGATVEATRFGITCRYATSSTDIGTLTGSNATGSSATLDVEASIPFHSGSFLCGAGATAWTGSYTVGSPTTLNVDPETGGEEGLTGINVSPDTWTFLTNGATHTFTVKNTGKAAIKDLDLTYPIAFIKIIGGNCGIELKAGDDCEVTLERTAKSNPPGSFIAESKDAGAAGSSILHAK